MKMYANHNKGKSLKKSRSVKASKINSKRRTVMASVDYDSLRADYKYDNYEYLSPEDCLDNFAYNYSNSSDYIGDAISEQADSSVDIYNSELCKSCWDIYQSGAYEQAKFDGLLEGADDLMKLLQTCQYEFYTGVLYENLDAVMRNLVLEYLKDEKIDVTEDQWDDICDDILTDVDNNDRISDICERVTDFLNDSDEEDDEEDEE